MTNTKYSKSAVARIIGKSRATISRHIKSGKLSSEVDEHGNEVIDASELHRAYGDDCRFEHEEKRGETSETKRSGAEPNDAVVAMKEMQKQLIRQYEAQIDHLKDVLKAAQDGQNSVTKLLEDRSSESNTWQASLEAMSERIANRTEKRIQALQERHENEMIKLKRALYRERKRTWWQKLLS